MNLIKSFKIWAFSVLLLTAFSSNSFAQDTLVLSSFKLNGPPEKAYLTNALFDMTLTRLSSYDVKVVGHKSVVDSIDNAKSLMTSKGATHLINASITILGEAVSIDGRIYNSQGGESLFYLKLDDSGELINASELIAERRKSVV